MFARAQPDHERAPPDRRHDPTRIARRHRSEGIGSIEDHGRVPDRIDEVMAVRELVMDPMPDYLGVGFGVEPVSPFEKTGPNFGVVLDDPVVDHRDFAPAHERVRVRPGRLAVRGPSGVRDAGGPVRRLRSTAASRSATLPTVLTRSMRSFIIASPAES